MFLLADAISPPIKVLSPFTFVGQNITCSWNAVRTVVVSVSGLTWRLFISTHPFAELIAQCPVNPLFISLTHQNPVTAKYILLENAVHSQSRVPLGLRSNCERKLGVAFCTLLVI